MTFPAALSIVTLGVADLERSIAFYQALGWRKASSSIEGAIAWFDLGGVSLGVFPAAELAEDSGLSGGHDPGAAFRGVTLAVNLTTDVEVDEAVATAVAAGAVITVGPVRTDYGVYHCCFTDPDGHLWEVAHADFPFVDGRMTIP